MSKFSQKPIKAQQDTAVENSDLKTGIVSSNISEARKKVINKFKGMAEDLEWFEPVIIPGYRTIG